MAGQNPYHEGRSKSIPRRQVKIHTTKAGQNPYHEGRSKSIPRRQVKIHTTKAGQNPYHEGRSKSIPRRQVKIHTMKADSRSSESMLAWARTHDSSHHSGTDALARATFSRPGEIRPEATPLSRLSELCLAQAINPGKYLGTTLSPSLGRAPLAQARITQWLPDFLLSTIFKNCKIWDVTCGICTSTDHYSDVCPSLLDPRTDDNAEHAVPARNQSFNSKTRVFNSESNHPDGADGYFTETLQSQNSDKLPSQTMLNPRNVSVITLRLGKQTEVPTPRTDVDLEKEHDASKRNKSFLEENENTTRETHANQPSSSAAQQPFSIPLPLPPRINLSKKMGNMEELEKDLLDTFRKVQVNIPLLDAIKQIPRYAKFLNDLCTHKRKLKGNEIINMGMDVSEMIGMPVPHIPEKCKDPGTFTVPCIIGNRKFENAMLDLEASINVMPMNVFQFLSLGPLQPTSVVIQFAVRIYGHLRGEVPVGYPHLTLSAPLLFMLWGLSFLVFGNFSNQDCSAL
ncbi:hypothetical protein Lal_00024446 [Lupinus albus]|nr:hypothetical protein Lal_00024446 [Lupinus albus]